MIAYDQTMSPYITLWGYQMQWGSEVPSVYDFDDPKVLGAFFSMALSNISVWVGSGEGDSGDGGDGGDIGPGGQIEINVSEGLTPTFSWTGGNARMLTVMSSGEAGANMWGIMTIAPSDFASPVTYGEVPSGAIEVFPLKPLVAGTTYQVMIMGVQEGTIGAKEFTP